MLVRARVPRYGRAMNSVFRMSSRTRVAALALLILLSQLLLLAHQVLDEHDEELSCEICLQAKAVEFATSPPAEFVFVLLLVFAGVAVFTLQAPRALAARWFSSRAPPR